MNTTSPLKQRQRFAVIDLEGVLLPELWIAIADYTEVDALHITTRDEPDYDILMAHRMQALSKHNITVPKIKKALRDVKPLAGAYEFLLKLRSVMPVVILSDTFEQLALPLMAQLGWPTLMCHTFVLNDNEIVDYKLRTTDQKAKAVAAFQSLNYKVVAAGDSYNDITMLSKADIGILFRASENVLTEYPELPSCTEYEDLLHLLTVES